MNNKNKLLIIRICTTKYNNKFMLCYYYSFFVSLIKLIF